jgi:hypothetical protein
MHLLQPRKLQQQQPFSLQELMPLRLPLQEFTGTTNAPDPSPCLKHASQRLTHACW